jgi:hypothetical protein
MINKCFHKNWETKSIVQKAVMQEEKISDEDFILAKMELDVMINKYKKMISYQTILIDFLNELLDDKKEKMQVLAQLMKDEVDKIINQVKEWHSEVNTKSDKATILFSDGEIQQTKGGELFGRRSMFSILPPLGIAEVFKFPIKYNNDFTCAWLTHEQAIEIRNRMSCLRV